MHRKIKRITETEITLVPNSDTTTKAFLFGQQRYVPLCVRRYAHHFQALVIIIGPVLRIRVLCLAVAELLPIPVRSINSHETLALSLQQILPRIFIPAIDKVSMEAIPLADLPSMLVNSYPSKYQTKLLTAPHASLKGGTPFQPCGIALRVSYRTENLNEGIRFIPIGQRPPLAAAYVYSVILSGFTQSGKRRMACIWALQVDRGNAARGRLLRSSGPLPSHHQVMAVMCSSISS